MKSHRLLWIVGTVLVLGGGAATALFLSSRRDVTCSSETAYQAYREASANEGRFYMKEARTGYARALELDPHFAMAMLGLARQSKDEAQADGLIRRAVREKGRLTERERLHVEMQQAFAEKRRDDGVKIAHELHAKFPEDVRSASVLASSELQKGRPEQAIRIFEELLSIEPNNAEAYNQIGYYHGYRGDYDKALDYLKKYQFIAADNANPFDSLGEIQAYSGHYNEAIENLNRALAIKPDFIESIAHLGVAYEGEGEYARAIETYEKASTMSESPDMRGEYLRMAMRASFYAKDVAAMERLNKAVRALPRTKHSEMDEAFCDAALDLAHGRPADAEKRLRDLEPKLAEYVRGEKPPEGYKPHFPAWNMLMALALDAQGKTDDALVLWQKNANPPNPYGNFPDRRAIYEARARVAAVLARRGELDKAEKLIAENRQWNPSWAPTRDLESTVAELRRAKVLAAAK